jgi:hypothetical protein
MKVLTALRALVVSGDNVSERVRRGGRELMGE